MTVLTIKTTVVVAFSADDRLRISIAKLVEDLSEWAQEEGLTWRVGRSGGNRLRVVSSTPASEAENGSTSALAWTCSELDRAFSALDIDQSLLVARAETRLLGASDDETGDY